MLNRLDALHLGYGCSGFMIKRAVEEDLLRPLARRALRLAPPEASACS
jgi:hypothetical protein